MTISQYDLYKVRQTIIEMLEDRKYITNETPIFLPLDLITKMYNQFKNESTPLFDFNIRHSIKKEKIHVHFTFNYNPTKILNYVNAYRNHYNISHNDKILCVICSELSESQYTKLITIETNNLQIYEYKKLLFNISKHDLVPKHEIINHDEHEEIKEKYKLTSIYQLPFILKTDPMAKYLNLDNGDICKITRTNNTSGEHIIYRICV